MPRKHNKLYYELPDFDVLGDVLRSLRLKSRVFCRAQLSGPWVIDFPRQNMMHFHILERGNAWLELDAKPPPRALLAGDLVVIGPGRSFRITDQPARRNVKPLPLPEARAVLICGSFQFDEAADHPLLDLLPDFVQVRSNGESAATCLDLVARLLTAEVSQRQPGTQKVISSLTDILFVQALRQWMGEGTVRPAGWLGALKHPQIGPVLAAVHERPEALWTVDKLARRANLSRSAFSTRFARVVGETAQVYLTRLRMQRALTLLEQDHLSLTEIASAVGYDSEAAFSKAFKRWRGKTPGQVRREFDGAQK
jgi:AraC-like DNA-binding protein